MTDVERLERLDPEIDEKNQDVTQMEEKGNLSNVANMSDGEVERLAELLDQARKGTESEHKMTLLQALKTYPKASAWSIALSFGVVMEGQCSPTFSAKPLSLTRWCRL